jgi:phosphate:Na+ symporter
MQSTDLNLIRMFGELFGGLALFLFGLELMTTGLKVIAGSRLQSLLGTLTANRFRGVLAGAFVTALLNSSTITTVLMVGFVSAGLMTLVQAVPMIMGANIGSTFTAQLMAFNVTALTPFLLGSGFLLHAFGGRQLFRQIGGIILGLGLLFLGIQFMGDATRPLRTYQPFIDAVQDMQNPIVGILVGAIFTAIVQSSAATLAIVIALASQGLMPLEAGISLILGANIGTCGTALLAAIGKPREAAQVGVVHLLFNVLGVLLFVFFIPQFADFVRHISPSAPELDGAARLAAETPRQVANTHTIFSVGSTLILIWFAGPLAKLAQIIAPSRPTAISRAGDPAFLDDSYLAVPSTALERTRLELVRLGEMVLRLVRRGPLALVGDQSEGINALLTEEKEISRLTSAILQYIGRLSEEEHGEAESRALVGLAQITSNLDSIGEIMTTNIVSLGQEAMKESIDLNTLRDETTARFASAVAQDLEDAIRLIGEPNPQGIESVQGYKADTESLAGIARQSIVEKVRLTDKADVMRFRLANELIEQYKQIGHIGRRIAENVVDIARPHGAS